MGLSTGIVHLVGAEPQCLKDLPFRAWAQADALPVPLAMLMSPDSCQGFISLGQGQMQHWLVPGSISPCLGISARQTSLAAASNLALFKILGKDWWESHPVLQLLPGHVIPGNSYHRR